MQTEFGDAQPPKELTKICNGLTVSGMVCQGFTYNSGLKTACFQGQLPSLPLILKYSACNGPTVSLWAGPMTHIDMLLWYAGIVIGITLGISNDADTVHALMIALFFHQGNEGLALGVLFVKAGYTPLKFMLLASAFIIVTPLGVASGIVISSKYNGLSKAALGTEGIFNAISAGILSYNGLCDLIVPTFSDDDLPQS